MAGFWRMSMQLYITMIGLLCGLVQPQSKDGTGMRQDFVPGTQVGQPMSNIFDHLEDFKLDPQY